MERIFVQIASYRDTECQWTVKDMFEKAEQPDRVFVGICWQFDEEADKDCFVGPYARPDQVREYRIPAQESRGVCWARYQAQQLYAGEEYVLMIDSHMRFVPGWDRLLIDMLKACNSAKPLLSAYPPAYTPPDQLDPNPQLTIQRLEPFNKQGDIRGHGVQLLYQPEAPVPGLFIAAGYVFSLGKVIQEVPYDPHMYFNQEEISLAVRLYTHGWDVFHPHRIALYHYYKSPDDVSNKRPLHWEDHKDWSGMQEIGRARLHDLVGHKRSQDPSVIRDLSKYGLGKKRSLKEFEAISGIHFRQLQVDGKSLYHSETTQQLASGNITGEPVVERIGLALPDMKLWDKHNIAQTLYRSDNQAILLMLMPIQFKEYCLEFFERIGAILEHHSIRPVCVFQCSTLRLSQVIGALPDRLEIYADPGALLFKALGWEKEALQNPLTVLTDKHRRIYWECKERNAQNHMAEIIRVINAGIK